eukprot:NODE_2856_length_457_cov_479.306373_g2258_i0.p1 GENE.NODE_2856_length_457_cov_479.306373_g2258_i0~~NODE_2856_length_457_cov_479.306373_g2258_i0.p1  ORF type:complete len:98 (+),score=12.61 NODE_2856_length_457_cov_479.306373_g2258_i0:77-370(+)
MALSLSLYGLGPIFTEPFRSSKRQKCFESKDTFYQCLDKNDQNADACEEQQKVYIGKCSVSYRRAFAEQRWEYLAQQGVIKTVPDTLSQHQEGKIKI